MTAGGPVQPGAAAPQAYGSGFSGGREPANLGDILERVLDKGIVIAGDIRVNLLDIELLTIKLRLIIASVDTARQLGINWWERDPWLTSNDSGSRELAAENRRLRDLLAAIERGGEGAPAVPAAVEDPARDAAPTSPDDTGGGRARARDVRPADEGADG